MRSEADVGDSSYAVGIVYFEGSDELARCLDSIAAQSHMPSKVIVIDHSGVPDSPVGLRARRAGVEWVVAVNGGYAAGANRVIEETRELCPDVRFLLVLNPDVELERDFCRILIEAMSVRSDIALGSGRLLRPGGKVIDSAGIEMGRTRRFRDRGSGEPDDGRYARIEVVSAVSGAALMLRRELLPDLAIDGEIFDEDFFVYHEDTDLAWRARLFGYSSLYVPAALATHVRKWRREERARIARHVRRHSFKNRYLEMVKNERPGQLLRDAPFILGAEAARLCFAVIADRSLLPGYWDAIRHLPKTWKKRRIIQARAARRRGKRSDRSGDSRVGANGETSTDPSSGRRVWAADLDDEVG